MSNFNHFDAMQIGDSGWVPMPNGTYKNVNNNHYIDELGKEFDEKGNLIYDPNEDISDNS